MEKQDWILNEMPIAKGYKLNDYCYDIKGLNNTSITVVGSLSTARRVAAFQEMYDALKWIEKNTTKNGIAKYATAALTLADEGAK